MATETEMIKEQGKSFEEKTAQVKELLPDLIEVDPLAVFCPIGAKFTIKGKSFELFPLPLRKLAMLQRLGKSMVAMATTDQTDEAVDKAMITIAETICTIVDAPKEEADFFYNNLTQPMLEWILRTASLMSQGVNPKKA
ncbi:hypothetical protein KJ628_06020 [Patescibacteria group bacterium]|nr:hypothetical protein [Patescibacteria group bacterium]